MKFKLYGSIVALITPMLDNGDIDYKSLEGLVNWHIKSGTKAIASMGTTGESATLNSVEHIEVIRKTVEFSAGRIPIIAGTGANSTSEAIELTQKSSQVGAAACLLVTPYYNKPTQEGLYQHYKKIAQGVDIPQILYNVPNRTAVDMSVETIVRLSNIDNIVGIKDATGDLKIAKKLIENCPDNFIIYSGDDATAVDFILMGGDGGISVTANICPVAVATMYDKALNEDEAAQQINHKLQDLHNKLFVESNPIPVKWALAKMQKCGYGIRLPLTQLSEKYQQKLNIILQKMELI